MEAETVPALSQVTAEATREAEGELTITARFTNPGFETQVRTLPIPKLVRIHPFADVQEGKYDFDAVLWAAYHDPQITSGTSADKFSPGSTCTRAQVVTFLWRFAGSPEPASLENPFADVNPDKYYYRAVLWAAEQGITSGTAAGQFRPNAGCTRGQVAAFLWRFAGSPEPTSFENPFTDVKPGAYFETAVLWAAGAGITSGTSALTFSPNSTCTREQIVTFLYRFSENSARIRP